VSEPCKHERGLVDLDDLDDVVRLRLDLRDARAMVATKDAAIDAMAAVIVARDATIGRVRALLDDIAGPLWSVRGVREADLRAALEEPS
jgi:hypothetical protein